MVELLNVSYAYYDVVVHGKESATAMLNAPLPPDIDVTQRLQMVISEWKGAQVGHKLERLHQDCLDLVGPEKQLLPLRIIAVRELDSNSLAQAFRRYRFELDYGLDTIGRFDAALVPVMRESAPAGFLFAYEEDLPVQDQVALFAHAIGHLLMNHQQREAESHLDLDPEEGLTHTDRLAELRYLDISENRKHLDRKVLEAFPKLTKLIEPPEESPAEQTLATRDLLPFLRKQGWVNDYQRMPYRYTQGRVIPNSTQRGKRLTIDVLLQLWRSLPVAIVQVQRADESLEATLGRVRSTAPLLCLPFAYVFTQQKDFIELNWLDGKLSEPLLRATLPTREELQTRWFSALQLTDQKAIEALSYPYHPTQLPRYYQEAAINQAVIAALQALPRRGLRERRILLTLATGTGKTLVAFQILWKLKQTYQVGNVLFLADRSYLLDQAQVNTFSPFGEGVVRGQRTGDTAHDILFGTYQWLASMQDGVERYKTYPADYFAIIVIDECHRGSADENSDWRKVLEHFAPAVQIGLTATPLETEDVQTKQYFGAPVYTYSLSRGINDGYLAPYSVRRVQIGKMVQEETQTTEAKTNTPLQTLDQQIVMQTGHTMRLYTETIAAHLAQYLRQQADPRSQKTIVFCIDKDHAAKMRSALEEACADWTRPGDVVRIVDEDGTEGVRSLNQFCTVRERQPVIVTTARLLTTGVDVPTCKNIVLARGVGSIVEFKQIIGRGTRLYEPEKSWFTILDYAGAIKHFFDPGFDGDPVSIQREYLQPTAPPATDSDEAEAQTTPDAPITDTAPVDLALVASAESGAAAVETAEDWPNRGADYQIASEPGQVFKHGEDYVSTSQEVVEVTPSSQLAESAAAGTEDWPDEVSNSQTALYQPATIQIELPHTDAPPMPTSDTVQQDQQISSGPAFASAIPRPRAKAEPPAASRPSAEMEVIVKKANGQRIGVTGEYLYEMNVSGVGLRLGTVSEFAQQALKEIVKTPADLRRYWSDMQVRQQLTEQLANEVVGLDALARAQNLPDVDHFDLLLHLLFQQPTITRVERVQRLRTEHSTFFQPFEHNPLAKELLDAILDKYSHGEAPDVSDLRLLRVQPLNARTSKEWTQVFNQPQEPGSTKTHLKDILKKLQELLYSV